MFEGFWENIARYPRYLISFILGTFYALFQLLKPLLDRPVTAIALIGLAIGIFSFVFFTLRAMLGLGTI